MKKRRLSKKEFWDALTEAGGLYARCARIIEEKHGFAITRQAVRERADREPDRLMELVECSLDLAEEKLLQLFDSKNERIRLKAVEFYLRNKGKSRGYSERTEITGADGNGIALNKKYDLSDLSDEGLAALGKILEKSNEKV